jgi:hypothetical protein
MVLQQGDLRSHFDEPAFLVFSANGVLWAQGRLVMGAGFALAVRERYPDIDVRLGQEVRIAQQQNRFGDYFLVWADRIGALQVKHHWNQAADRTLLAKSLIRLNLHALQHLDALHYMNFPGIGHGHLERAAILPLLECLPDNVYVWEL